MCHDDDSRPPSPPRIGAVAEHGALTLTSADGTPFLAYQAIPAEAIGRNVVILPDVRGLHPYYRDLAVRFAEAGFHAIAFDYFGRTAGLTERDDDFDWAALIATVQDAHILADVRASAEHLAAIQAAPTFTLGFCFGGSASWRLAASELDLAGCMGFYGRPSKIADVEDSLAHPMLLLAGGADAATPEQEFHDLDARLRDRGVPHELHVYAGAPHSFFDRAFAQWQPACEDSWRRILAFTDTHA